MTLFVFLVQDRQSYDDSCISRFKIETAMILGVQLVQDRESYDVKCISRTGKSE